MRGNNMLDEKTKALNNFCEITTYGLNRRKQSPNCPSELQKYCRRATELFLLTNPTQERVADFEAYLPGAWMLVDADERHMNVGIESIPVEFQQNIEKYQEIQKMNEGPNLHMM